MFASVILVSIRGVRSLNPHHFRPPWPIFSKAQGWRKRGPTIREHLQLPGQDREFPELSPKFKQENPAELSHYTGTQVTGFVNPVNNEIVHVKEMFPEWKRYRKLVFKYGSEENIETVTFEAEKWPPPKTTSRFLFNVHYAPLIRRMYKDQEYFEDTKMINTGLDD